jgi:uncharacterized protein (DUF1330 family)
LHATSIDRKLESGVELEGLPMAAYRIGLAQMRDAEGYARYAQLAAPAFAQHPHRVLLRGGRFESLEGDLSFNRHVVLEFPSMQAALNCYRSIEYQRAAAVRRAASARCELVLVEGFSIPEAR